MEVAMAASGTGQFFFTLFSLLLWKNAPLPPCDCDKLEQHSLQVREERGKVNEWPTQKDHWRW